MPTLSRSVEVTDSLLSRYGKLIYKMTGIHISPNKKQLLSNRLRRRLRATGIDTFEEYLDHLQKLPSADPEWDAFLQEITTHETYLFRDQSHWKWFQDTYLDEIGRQARAGERKKTLRIWSAACSTGDEACTIASCIADRLSDVSQWKVDILGTDIGIEAVKSAEAQTFNKRAMQHVPDNYRSRYFAKAANSDVWTARPNLTRWMRFRQHNLLNPVKDGPFDIVFVKNVLIYFDGESKKKAMAHIRNALKPGGTLITGPSEGVGDLIKDLKREAGWRHLVPESTSRVRSGMERA